MNQNPFLNLEAFFCRVRGRRHCTFLSNSSSKSKPYLLTKVILTITTIGLKVKQRNGQQNESGFNSKDKPRITILLLTLDKNEKKGSVNDVRKRGTCPAISRCISQCINSREYLLWITMKEGLMVLFTYTNRRKGIEWLSFFTKERFMINSKPYSNVVRQWSE